MRFFLSKRATTNPSPPLLPLPATTKTPFLAARPKRSRIALVISSPACSIRVRLGTPYFWIVKRSISRICAAVTTSMLKKFKPFKSFNRSAPFKRFERLAPFERFEPLFSRFGEQLLHLAHGLFDPGDDRASDNTVADVEFNDLRNAGD